MTNVSIVTLYVSPADKDKAFPLDNVLCPVQAFLYPAVSGDMFAASGNGLQRSNAEDEGVDNHGTQTRVMGDRSWLTRDNICGSRV